MQKHIRKPVLALLKLGFRLPEIRDMTEEEMVGWIEAYGDLINSEQTRHKTYKVRKKAKDS